MGSLLDRHDRPLRSLRLSVTDRCNFRCSYCMPEENYTWLPREDILSLEEMTQVAQAFVAQGVRRLRLTGGEPLLRKDLVTLVEMLARIPGVEDLALTTNAMLLPGLASDLRAAGLQRLNISLDTLDRDRFQRLTRRDALEDVLTGIEAATAAGFRGTKVDTVVLRGENDQEIPDLLRFGKEHGLQIRFIEYMDVGGATGWKPELVSTRDDMLDTIRRSHGTVEEVPPREVSAPANLYRLSDGQEFGIIASTTHPFCSHCDRSRVAADGTWYTCLYAQDGFDLRAPLREGLSSEGLQELIRGHWQRREDRGAEDRKRAPQRGPSVDLDTLLADPRLEMHTRGG